MKYVVTDYGNKKEILKFPDHYVAVPVMVSDAGIATNSEGKKIVPAGTVVGGGFLTDNSKKAVKANDATAEGVLFNDVDVTYGAAPGAALIHGFLSLAKLPVAPTTEAKAALKQISFLV